MNKYISYISFVWYMSLISINISFKLDEKGAECDIDEGCVRNIHQDVANLNCVFGVYFIFWVFMVELFSDEMNRFGGSWLTFLHNLSTSIFYWHWHFFIICLRLSSIFSVEGHKEQFHVLIQPQIGSYPYLIFVNFVIVTNMSYGLTVMIRPQRSCLGPWIISQEVPGKDTSEHNPFEKYFNTLHGDVLV